MKKICALFLTLASFSLIAADNPGAIKAIPFSALKNSSAQAIEICKALNNACSDQSRLWQEKGSGETFYLTDSTPVLIKITRAGGTYVKAGQWDFSHHPITDNSDDGELTRSDTYVFPALYPLSKTQQAVALVSKWFTGYSGGGRDAEYADFLLLNSDGSFKTAFNNIPFSSSETIRACFTDEEYARSSHCHDESSRILLLKFIDEGKAYYSWKFITKSSDWPSFTDKSAMTVETTEQVMVPFQNQSQ